MIRLRLITTDGSILKIDTGEYLLLSNNFCQIKPAYKSLKNQIDTSSLYATDGINYYKYLCRIILITYFVCDCGNNYNTLNNTRYNVCGKTVDWLGNVLSYLNYISIFSLEDEGYGIVTVQYNITSILSFCYLRINVLNAETLYKGGYLILTENVIESNYTISGRVYNNNGSLHGDWGMPNTYNYT
ncbi:hypothetical protein Glove_346g151 [Diversispora epigaea]|uniref:Uncharacterized protein n=1 Tax=Diversispora epigaea TaxID=1348612 RepID=A0A397HHZ9_9GLOM|nr:hypothetical protein Glove_346g151 [Diversispora epigaea]